MELKKRRFLWALIFISHHASADWSSNGEIGYNALSGNTENKSIVLGLASKGSYGSWLHSVETDSLFASNENETSAEIHNIKAHSSYDTGLGPYKFGRIRYQYDRFGDYSYQLAASIGVGKHIIDTKEYSLSVAVGLGVRKSRLNEGANAFNEAVYTAKLTHERKITQTVSLLSWFSSEFGGHNNYYEGEFSLNLGISDALGLNAAYTLKRNSDRPIESDDLNSYTKVAVTYKIN